jgi:hypothetical protein
MLLTADLVNIFTMFIPQLLSYPNPTDPLNGEAASLMLRDPAAYAARIRDSVKLHASKPVAFDDGEGTGGNGGGSSSGSRNRGRSVSDLSSKAGCSSASSSGTGSSFGSPSLMSLGSSSAGDVSDHHGFNLCCCCCFQCGVLCACVVVQHAGVSSA